jgi:hypothetical protein
MFRLYAPGPDTNRTARFSGNLIPLRNTSGPQPDGWIAMSS